MRTPPRSLLPGLALALASLTAGSARAQSCAASAARPTGAPRDGDVLRERPYRLLPFDGLPAEQRGPIEWVGESRAAYERARGDARFALRKLEYLSGGLRVVAYVYGPRAVGECRAVVVYNRGSAIAGDLAPALLPTLHRLAGHGFLVVAPMYRQSDGGEGRDEVGGADLADVLNAVTLAKALPGADTARVFMYGESRGGMMTYQAMRDGVPVRAAATVGAFTHFDSLLGNDPRSRAAARTMFPDYEQNRDAIVRRRSAVYWADSLRVPLLILHGGADRQVSPRQSLRLALLLDAAKRPYALHVLAGGSHTLGQLASTRDSLVADWFRRHER